MAQGYQIGTVLVIDDDPIIHEIIRAFMENFSPLNVLSAANGKIAVAAVQASQDDIDIIFCDLHMPEMDGIELLTHLQSVHCRAQIVILSGANNVVMRSAEELAFVYGLNIIASIPKPVDFDHLDHIISIAMDEKRRAA